ncbi:MAG: hypothetical protein K2X91_01475 [Thermoleophilia bacterium]|nr:hypothetical protein [Thermoleophilia bacterium]
MTEREMEEEALRAHELSQLLDRAERAQEAGDEDGAERLRAEAETFARAHDLSSDPPDAAEILADGK